MIEKTTGQAAAATSQYHSPEELHQLMVHRPDEFRRVLLERSKPPRPAQGQKPAKKKRGRPPKLDERAKELVCKMISIGISQRQTAAIVGCTSSAISHAARRDKKFSDQIRRAARISEVAPLMTIVESARTSWRAAAWLMKNHHPHAWLRRENSKAKEQEAVESTDRIMQQCQGDLM